MSERNVVPILLEGLQRLEYRGYDSAGLVVGHDGQLERVEVQMLLRLLEPEPAGLGRFLA